ncbi:MAG: YheV family putative metal-binding protein [Cellvibrionales bacterium TMED148]|nr:hypothetical protein [Porticoccaceae bacterium]RPG93424.1 MAG: YheV family putative metal-binding protein [Cellvibrionales bacterium TMED148]|tara:strand:- start:463 stop:699 length:237 start_codon:yes stop_codon:yes gene_type:complete
MAYSEKKRFIAGVVCPKCSKMDKLLVFSKNDVDYRECSACGFSDQVRFSAVPREIKTRVSRPSEGEGQQVDVITLLDD